MKARLISVILVAAVLVLRLAIGGSDAAGYSPLAALVLGAAVMIPDRRWALLPLGAFLISDIALNVMHGQAPLHPYMAVTAGFYAGVFLLGHRVAQARSLALPFLGATVLSVIAFHLVANASAWAMNPAYAKSIGGLIQAQTTGLAGFPPAWAFLLKSLIGNLAFAGLFLVALAPVRSRGLEPVEAPTG